MHRINLLAAILLLAFFSCKKTSNNYSPIDSKITINMQETMDTGSLGRHLIFNCFTDKFFDCSNYTIINHVENNGGHISIEFTSVQKPEICLGYNSASMNAKTRVDLGKLSNGSYPLSITNDKTPFSKTVSNGTLIVTDNDYTVSFNDLKDCSFVYNNLNKIPTHTIWGIIRNKSTLSEINSFIDSLKWYGAQTYVGPLGNYHYFNLNSNYNVLQTTNEPYYTEFFIYHFAGNMDDLNNLVNRYGARNRDSLWIDLSTDKGLYYHTGFEAVQTIN